CTLRTEVNPCKEDSSLGKATLAGHNQLQERERKEKKRMHCAHQMVERNSADFDWGPASIETNLALPNLLKKSLSPSCRALWSALKQGLKGMFDRGPNISFEADLYGIKVGNKIEVANKGEV
ncbi:Suppression of tumorigenicity 18 protein, partial [Frankliniella fusca]